MIDYKEAKHILRLLRSNTISNRSLGLLLLETQNVLPMLQQIVEEEMGYSYLSNNVLFKNVGVISEETISTINKTVVEIVETKRQKTSFKSRAQKMKSVDASITFSFWLFRFLQSYLSESIEFLFDQDEASLQYLILVKEPLLWDGIQSKVEALMHINAFIEAQNNQGMDLRLAKRTLSKAVANSLTYFELEMITKAPINFVILPDQNLEQWFCIQKLTFDLILE
ncbi:hypothetical protein [Microscilla marina]|uniref:Uncharacterized protein n=1 Tax=Microscilla marina ATCC 23134 TaxID=313606 RepID=A1ZPT4_MICM2|nr:hypothetical protein [Microscilla marina]EAY27589.1 hypothetical protein M23134_02836 [Microscilla marina ATCC 23134]